MSLLSDSIEAFIKELMLQEEMGNQVDVRRNELAEYFHCAPSQINYVLTTRFSPARGYYTQSRRGGGGYIRIIRVEHETNASYLLHLVQNQIGEEITEPAAKDTIRHLAEDKLITLREASLMMSVIDDKSIRISVQNKDRYRALLMKEMLASLIRCTSDAERG